MPRPIPFLLLLTWSSATICTLRFAARTSPIVPKFDDWAMALPAFSGHVESMLAWTWGALNEHRVVLPKLVYWAAFRLSGGDFRSGSFVGIVLLAAVAAAAMLLARRLRGRSDPADAFFPLILLHWGQAHCWHLSPALNFTLTAALYLAAILAVLGEPGEVRAGALGVFALCALPLPLCSMNGWLLAWPLWAWLLAVTLRRRGTRAASFLWAATGALLVLQLCTLFGIQQLQKASLTHAIGTATVWTRLANVADTLAMSLGWVGWCQRPAARAFMLAVIVLELVALARAWRARPDDRERVAALAAGLAATLGLTVALQVGRADLSGDDLWSTTRYAMISVPVLVMAFLIALVSASERTSLAVGRGLALLAAVIYIGHVYELAGYPWAQTFADSIAVVDDSLIRGALNGASDQRLSDQFFIYEGRYDRKLGAVWMSWWRAACLVPNAERFRYMAVPWDVERTPRLDFTQRGSERCLRAGWHACRDRDGIRSVCPSAELAFTLRSAAPRRLRIRLLANLAPPFRRQVVHVAVNGTPLGVFTLERPGWEDVDVLVPPACLIGPGVLEFALEGHLAPDQVGWTPLEQLNGVKLQTLIFE